MDDHKTEILKDAIDSKFAPTDPEFDIEVAWKKIRRDLNTRIYKSATPKSGTRVRKSSIKNGIIAGIQFMQPDEDDDDTI